MGHQLPWGGSPTEPPADSCLSSGPQQARQWRAGQVLLHAQNGPAESMRCHQGSHFALSVLSVQVVLGPLEDRQTHSLGL